MEFSAPQMVEGAVVKAHKDSHSPVTLQQQLRASKLATTALCTSQFWFFLLEKQDWDKCLWIKGFFSKLLVYE